MIAKTISLCGSIINFSAWLGFLLICFLSFFYIPWRHSDSYLLIFTVGSLLSALSLYLALKPGVFPPLPVKLLPHRSLLSIIMFGVALRVAWVYLVPPIQLSDFQDYVNTAQALLQTGQHVQFVDSYELKAWRPPGYTFVLAFCMALFGADNAYIPAFTNILFYVLTCFVLDKIVRPIGGGKNAAMAVLILTLWPSDITITGLALVEPLSLLLFTFGVWAFFETQKTGSIGFAILAGLATGYGALVKPAVLMLPFLWFLFHVMTKAYRWPAISRTLIAVICMVMVIAPWSIRNYYALGKVVLISTNGGDNFYRANNPNASGGFTRKGERDLNQYLHDEVLWNATGFSWGKEWIKENPLGFIKLIFKKQGILLGEDSTGVYWTLYRGYNESGVLYTVLTIISESWWTTILILSAVGVIKNRTMLAQNPYGGLLLWMTLYFVVIHSVFESQPRYHLPMIGFLAILAAFALTSPSPAENDSRTAS